MSLRPRLTLLLAPALLLHPAGPATAQETSPIGGAHASPQGDVPMPILADADSSSTKRRLLDLAFRTASALPHEPHIKNRSKAQEWVIDQYLELGQPRTALRCIEQVDNWRRGAGYADLAFHCAENGRREEALYFARLADEIAEDPGDDTEQSWRKDRIKVRVAQTHALIGDSARAVELGADVVPSESGKVEAVQASMSEADDFERHLAYADAVSVSTDFDHLRNAIDVCAELFSRYYGDAERRQVAEDEIERLWEKLPRLIRIDVTLDLSRRALEQGDGAKALALVREGIEIQGLAPWTLEDDVAITSRLARARYEAGDQRAALEMAQGALARYQAGSEEIVDIFRAECLRRLAEAFTIMQEPESAALVYRMALEEGVHNPNSRPRAMDLTATCVSMVTVAFEPDEDLWERMAEVHAALGAPW